jgi:predicted dehydrogenase
MKIAVVGLGFMGSTHLHALQHVPGIQLAAIVSCDPAKRAGDLTGVGGNLPKETTLGQFHFGGVRKYSRVEEAIEDPDIDAIDICLPSDRHAPVAIAALRAGKHVLVEKPLALDGESADAVVMEAERSGRILMVGHVLRFIPAYQRAAEVLRAGTLGVVRSGFFRRRCGAPTWSRWLTDSARSGGAVLDLLIHDIDFCLHVFGKPPLVNAVGSVEMERGIDWIEARLLYNDFGPVIVTGGWHHPKSYPFSMEFTVVSDSGTLEYGSDGRPLRLYDASGSVEAVETPDHNPWAAELSYFAECVRDGRQPDLCAPRESARAVKVARLLMRSREREGEDMLCAF